MVKHIPITNKVRKQIDIREFLGILAQDETTELKKIVKERKRSLNRSFSKS